MAISAIGAVGATYYPAGTAQVTSPYASYEQQLALQELESLTSLGSSGSGSGTVDSGLSSGDLLDLSPVALNILNGIGTTTPLNSATPAALDTADANATVLATTNTANTTPLTTTNTTGGTTDTVTVNGTIGTDTTLTQAQQTEIAAIVSEYAAAPVTSQTFTQIENALTAVGINPQQLSLQQLLTGYEYAYEPGLAFNGQLYTDTLASELDYA